MACEICRRNSCARSFHSFEEQEAFDSVADEIKDRCKSNMQNAVNRIDGEYDDNDIYLIKLEDVLAVIDNIDL